MPHTRKPGTSGHDAEAGLNPRKRAVQARSAFTVDTILEGAARILEVAGTAGYTTNAIAERAGVSVGSLYQYFPNKDAITLALIERELRLVVAEVTAAAEHPDWREGLRAMATAAVRHQLRRPVLARLLDDAEDRMPAPDETVPAGAIHAAVLKVVRRARVDHLGSAEQLTSDLIGITRGMTDSAGRAGETDDTDLQRRVCRAVLNYLA